MMKIHTHDTTLHMLLANERCRHMYEKSKTHGIPSELRMKLRSSPNPGNTARDS